MDPAKQISIKVTTYYVYLSPFFTDLPEPPSALKTLSKFQKVLHTTYIKFIYSEKATNFCKISTVDLSYVVTVKSTVEISQNFVAFSEYMNFTTKYKKCGLRVYALPVRLQCIAM